MQNLMLALLATLLSACTGEAADDRTADGNGGAVADTLVVSSDPELRALAERILPGLAARSGLELRAPVRLERRSRAQLEQYLTWKLDEEFPPERAHHLRTVYATLGLMDVDVDLRALLLSVYGEQVAGFYDPDSTALFVLDDQPAEVLEPVLLHELVHAVQDQWADLSALTDPAVGNDRTTAVQAAIEGHATLVMLEFLAERAQGSPVDLTGIPGFGERMGTVLQAARTQYPELAAAPRIIQEGLLFPYLEGAGFVLEVWRSRATRDGALQDLFPVSTEQVMDPSRFLSDPPDDPIPIALTATGGEVVYQDGLGALEVRILLEELAGSGAGGAAEGWDGDRYLLLRDESGRYALAWASVWDDVEARDRFVETLRPGLARLAGTPRLVPLDVGGHAGALLRVGGAGEVS
ncbi:MAG: hypothetical protein RQ751_10900, partial [Longimicrobiales bacterium]|nr:hypothetical protein [Longimicrobiales bacterium]